MPNIVIREYDKTSAGIGLYANFSVVVPGFVAKDTDVFDENGVYEVSSQEDFENNVGKVAAQIAIAAEAPSGVINKKLSQAEFNELMNEDVALTKVFTTIANEDPTNIGLLRDSQFIYEPIVEQDAWRASAVYSIIEVDNRGRDGREILHYGNQIAYELLGLGYTVLYKKIDVSLPLADTLERDSWWAPLKDKSTYDFRFVVTGLMDDTKNTNEAVRSLVHNEPNVDSASNGRGDCVALLDLPKESYVGKTQAEAITGLKAAAQALTASQYTALFAPFVVYNMKTDRAYNNSTFPASFHYLACAAKAASDFNEWYATAGYTRGVSNYSINSLGCKLGEAAVDALQPRHIAGGVDKAVNLIIKVKSNYYLWGNRTAAKLGEENTENGDLRASHFLNIRQLCTTIKKQVYITCRRYTFDPNSDVLWINFCNGIRPLLEKMKADQGIEDYKFIKVKTNKKALLKAKIRIVPIEAVEDFDISLYLEDSISGADVEEDDSVAE